MTTIPPPPRQPFLSPGTTSLCAVMDRGTTLALDDCMAGHTLEVERRDDGVLLVRVRSDQMTQEPLPDAVFSFRAGDPQYSYWLQWLLNANPACDAKPAG